MDIPDEQVERALMKLLADGKVTVSPEMAARIAQAAGAGGNPLGATCVVEKAVPGQGPQLIEKMRLKMPLRFAAHVECVGADGQTKWKDTLDFGEQ